MSINYDKLEAYLDKYRFIDAADVPKDYRPEDKNKKGVLLMGKVSYLDGYGLMSELNQAICELAMIDPMLHLIPCGESEDNK